MPVPKWLKMILGILLLPFCVGAVTALWRVIGETGRAEAVWVPMAAGAACWWVVFLMMPTPMRLYVLGHELTHVLWAWLFGGKVKRMKVSAQGGHVIVTRNNFLISLSPYFFPFYVVLVVIGFVIGDAIWGWSGQVIWFHLLTGAAYSFHLTLTWHILQSRQSDITNQGYLFSTVIIFLGNASVLLMGLPLIAAQVTVRTSLSWWLRDSWEVVRWMIQGTSNSI